MFDDFDTWDEAEEQSPLDAFLQEGWITEILHEVKSGKEATVHCCRAASTTGLPLIAAKVYRSRQRRDFRNDAVYQEGRYIPDKRLRRAVAKRSAAGRAFAFNSWIEHEFTTLCALHAAGADVPRPVACAANGALSEYIGEPVPYRRRGIGLPAEVLLMEYIGDIHQPAPHLARVTLEPDEAVPLFQRVVQNIELALARGIVHADLSPFNILYWDGAITVIDFPQAVDARSNSNAHELLERDVDNVYRYFARQGVRADPARLSGWLWRRFMRGDL